MIRTTCLGGDERERLADEVVRDRVVVAVEADVGLLARGDRLDEVAGEGVLGEGSRRGRSSSSASRTRRPAGSPGTWRAWATRSIQSASCALRSSTEVNRRAAKKAWRRYWIVRSTLPFSLPREGAQGCGAKW